MLFKIVTLFLFILTSGLWFTEVGRRNRGWLFVAGIATAVPMFIFYFPSIPSIPSNNTDRDESRPLPQLPIAKFDNLVNDVFELVDNETTAVNFKKLRDNTPYISWNNSTGRDEIQPFENFLPYVLTFRSGTVMLRFEEFPDFKDDSGVVARWEVRGWERHPIWGPDMLSLSREFYLSDEGSKVIDEKVVSTLITKGFSLNTVKTCQPKTQHSIFSLRKGHTEAVLIIANEPSRMGISKKISIIFRKEEDLFFRDQIDNRIRSFEDFMLFDVGIQDCYKNDVKLRATPFRLESAFARRDYKWGEHRKDLFSSGQKIRVPGATVYDLVYEYRDTEVLRNPNNKYYIAIQEKIDQKEKLGMKGKSSANIEDIVGDWGCNNPYFDLHVSKVGKDIVFDISQFGVFRLNRVFDYNGWMVGFGTFRDKTRNKENQYISIAAYTVKEDRLITVKLEETYSGEWKRC